MAERQQAVEQRDGVGLPHAERDDVGLAAESTDEPRRRSVDGGATTSAMSTEHRHPNFMPFFTRSGWPAPTFWLTNVASAMAKQVTGRKAKPSTLLYAPHPAMACAPNELM